MKKFFLNTSLVIISILVAYGLMEMLLRLAMPMLPTAFFNNQCRELRTIGQTSKEGSAPKSPYIAVIGDSYGAGQGDWFISTHYNLNGRYQATHLLQDKTEQDVLSLSRCGAGNYDGAGIFAVNTWRYLNDAGFDIPAPDTVVVYFYEGNDISDNQRFLERHFDPDYDRDRLFDDEYFARFEQDMDTKHCQGELPRMQDTFILGNYLSRLIEGLVYSATKTREDLPPGEHFKATLAGKTVWLPDATEARIENYSEEDINSSIRVFDRAMLRVSNIWPDARKFFLYIPSPLTTYDLHGEDAQARMDVSRMMERKVEAAGRRHGFTYIDFASNLRQTAKDQYVHGPKDWGHLNKSGYEVLAESIASAVQQ